MTLEQIFIHLPTLSTPRLVIRPLEMKDVETMHEIRSDPEVRKMYGVNPSKSLEQTREWVKKDNSGKLQKWGVNLLRL